MDRIKCNNEYINLITRDEVVELHSLLSTHDEIKKLLPEPIYPPGIKNRSNLDMAVERQATGSGDYFKYDTVYSNCASLLFGITKGHIFHNGNKRVAFLCMLKHLYKNGLVMKPHNSHDDIYKMLKELASTEVEIMAYANQKKYRSYYRSICNEYGDKEWSSDAIVCFLDRWLRCNTMSKNKQARSLKWKNLFKQLEQFGLIYTIEKHSNGQQMVVIEEKPKKGILKLFTKNVKEIYPYRGETCNHRMINNIRNDFNLTKDNGVDNTMFYSENVFIDEELTAYRKLIYRLSLT